MNGTVVFPLDILLNITGGSLGRSALVPNDFLEGNVSQHVCIIRPVFLSNNFIHNVVLSPYFQKLVFESTTGAGREGLPKYNLEQFLVPIPPLSEQHRIVTKIEQLMKLCDELEQTVQQNQKYTQDLLQVALKEALEPKY
jgi:type I restriction enzyme S subunit